MTRQQAVTAPPEEHGRPLRADARRNRERVLEAARAAFAEEGADVQMEPIARRAGVGVGTVYRHFPTKQALITAVVTMWVAERAANAERALAIPDPWEAITDLVHRSAAAMARDAGLREIFADLPAKEMCPLENARFLEQLSVLVARATAAGVLRADVTADDVSALMCGLGATISRGSDWRRYADILLAGLRARAVSS